MAFHQSAYSCAFWGRLILMFYIHSHCNDENVPWYASLYAFGCLNLVFYIHIDTSGRVSPWYASWYAFWGRKDHCKKSCTVCTCVRFVPSVDEHVGLHCDFQIEWLIALRTNEPLISSVDLLVMGKVTSTWSKTQVTRYLFLHLLSITSSLVWRTLQIQIISTANSPFWKPT